jgi:hypothetical protein
MSRGKDASEAVNHEPEAVHQVLDAAVDRR